MKFGEAVALVLFVLLIAVEAMERRVSWLLYRDETYIKDRRRRSRDMRLGWGGYRHVAFGGGRRR